MRTRPTSSNALLIASTISESGMGMMPASTLETPVTPDAARPSGRITMPKAHAVSAQPVTSCKNVGAVVFFVFIWVMLFSFN